MAILNVNDTSGSFGFYGYFDKVSTPTRRKWWFNGESNWMGVVNCSGMSMPCNGGANQPFWVSIDGGSAYIPTITAGAVTLFDGLADTPHVIQIGINPAYSAGNAWTFLDGTNYLFSISGAAPSISAYGPMWAGTASGSPIKFYGSQHDVPNTNLTPKNKVATTNRTVGIDGLNIVAWQPNTYYDFGTTVAGSGTYNGYIYNCWQKHTSSTSFSYDLVTGGNWQQSDGFTVGTTFVFEAKTSEIWLFTDSTCYVGVAIDNGNMSTYTITGNNKKIWRRILSGLDNTQYHRYYIAASVANSLFGEASGIMLSSDGVFREISQPRLVGQYGDSITYGAGATEGFITTDYHRVSAFLGCIASQNGVSGYTNRDVWRQMHYCHKYKSVPEIAILATSFNNSVYTTLTRSITNNVAYFKIVGTVNLSGTGSGFPVAGETITTTDSLNSSYNGTFTVLSVSANGFSNSTNTVGTGSKTFIVNQNLNITNGEIIKFENTANTSIYVYGPVTSYDTSAGSLTINASTAAGAGTYSSWNVLGGMISVACSGADETTTADTTTGFMCQYRECVDKLISLGVKRVLVRPAIPGGGNDPGFRSQVKARISLNLVNNINDPRVIYTDITNWTGIATAEGSYPWGVAGSGSAGTHPNGTGYATMANYEMGQYQRLVRPWVTRMPKFIKSTRGYIRPPNASANDN